ncbi:hypothetical protein HGRIS_006959 [Hohenbuehelia grisea]|uniref:O-methyltransferase C-terminal domain-containing protein n=1 Tax=Hohenbuehelia grisea TaxID=104357 RepID=A0ABR3JAK3_9AGAR
MSSPLRQLLDLLTQSVSALEQSCAARGTKIPDLNAPFHPASEAFRADPAAAEAANIISAASLQLAAIMTPPPISMYSVIGGPFNAAALRVCLESHVTEILREGGPRGLTPEQIAAINGQDPKKLGRYLRTLATHHIYREVEPNVFTNNRLSSTLDTLKPVKDILSDPSKKNENTHGFAALAGHHLDETFKAASYSWEASLGISEADWTDTSKTPFNTAYKTSETFWKYLERPEEAFRQRRFGLGMQGVQALQPPEAIHTAFDWKSLDKKSVVVDVGGGVGTSVLNLVNRYSHINFVVQDLPGVIEDAKKVWAEKNPEAIKDGRVKLEAHDFFASQTHQPAVFFMKQILHDWPDHACAKILTQLRNAAGPDTKLVLMDSIIPFACHDPHANDETYFPGAIPKEAPAPLLANFGAVNALAYHADMVMGLLFNSQERTITHQIQLLRSTGWQVTTVNRQEGDGTFLQGVVAIPIGIN